MENYSNFSKSGAPARFLFYENGSWCEFPSGVADTLRVGFSERNAVVEAVTDGVFCLFDFNRMLQLRIDGGDERSVAWIDVDGNCFFPKRVVDGNGKFNGASGKLDGAGSPKLDIELDSSKSDGKFSSCNRKIDGVENKKIEIELHSSKSEGKFNVTNGKINGVEIELKLNLRKSRKREREEVLEGSGTEYEVVSPRWPRARVLGETEKAYVTVKDLFLSGITAVDPGAIVTGIHQVVRSSPLDKVRLEVFRKQMEVTKAARGGANMAFAWYGASENGVQVILMHGFSELSKVSGSEAHGAGVYLSPVRSAHMSAMLSEMDGNGEKHVILCRVIRGKCEKVEAGSPQMYPSSVEFDTGVNDLENPTWYVVWGANMNTHILPECVVSYRPTNHSLGQLRGSQALPSSSALFAKLFSKLGSTLPSSKVHQFRTLFSSYKEGKLPKDSFVKQLRTVVGDEMLSSAIREVRG